MVPVYSTCRLHLVVKETEVHRERARADDDSVRKTDVNTSKHPLMTVVTFGTNCQHLTAGWGLVLFV